MRILGTIVPPPTALMAFFDPKIAGSSAMLVGGADLPLG